jgi:superfamily II DNA or RNA helicase
LVVQTEDDYRNLGLDVGVLFGERKEWGHQHTIATWQSLSNLQKNQMAMEFIKDVVCVMIDEVHSAVGKVLRELLTGPFAHVPIRWGLTGTVPKEEHEAICLLAGIGPVVGNIRAVELQAKGVLANCQVEIVQLQDAVLKFPDYHSEHDFLVTDPNRLRYIASRITEWNESGSTLVLVDRIETGEMLEALLPNSVFIQGVTKLKTRQHEYQAIQTTDQRIIIATYGVASVGINVPRLFNLVLLEAGKSFVRVLQSIGRILRRANDKEYAMIYDVCSSLFFSKRHLPKRKSYYNEAKYPFVFKTIDYLR